MLLCCGMYRIGSTFFEAAGDDVEIESWNHEPELEIESWNHEQPEIQIESWNVREREIENWIHCINLTAGAVEWKLVTSSGPRNSPTSSPSTCRFEKLAWISMVPYTQRDIQRCDVSIFLFHFSASPDDNN